MKSFTTYHHLLYLLLSIWTYVPQTTCAEEVVINWYAFGPGYEDQAVEVGDTVKFDWGGFHNVYINPSGDCDGTDSVLVGLNSPAEYTFTEDDAGTTITFVCDVSGHCDAGNQIVNFVVGGGDDGPPPPDPLVVSWLYGPVLADETAQVGQTIKFEWFSGTHNVYIHPSGDCGTSDRIFLGSSSPVEYLVTEEDAGTTLTFACDVGSHCQGGNMIIDVVVPGGDDDCSDSDGIVVGEYTCSDIAGFPSGQLSTACDIDTVSSACPETCGLCSCEDSNEEIVDGVTCSFIAGLPSDTITFACGFSIVSDVCPVLCDAC